LSLPTHENIDQWLFDRIEGNLSLEQEQELDLFLLLNPYYENDLHAWEKSKVNFPAIDPAFVASMRFGVNEVAEEKRKKRPVAMWLFSSAAAIVCIGSLISLYFVKQPFSSTHQRQGARIAQPEHTNKNSAKVDPKYTHSNKKQSLTYSNGNMIANQENVVEVMWNGLKPIQHTDFSNSSAGAALSSSIVSNNEHKFEEINAIALRLARPILTQSTEGLELLNNTDAKEMAPTKHPLKIQLPDLKLSRSSVLGKYLRKEVVSATQKDRVYFMQEKSHLDISDAFAGNRSQTRFQTTSTGRWIGGSNQKLTQQLSIDVYSRNLKSGFGAVANYTDFGNGAIKDWNIRLIYSPKIAVGRYLSIEPSISYLFGQKSINSAKTTSLSSFEYTTNFVQQFNYDLSKPIGQHLLYRDLNMGMNLNLGPVYLGISTQNLLKHQDNIHTNKFDTITRANRTSTLFIGTDFSAKKGEIMFSPMLSHSVGLTNNLTQIGATIQVKGIVIGGNYGSNSSFGALVGYQAENFSFIAQSLKTKPLTSIEPSYIHQLTLRINTNISRKTRRYLYL
jgi:hypothetical protein